MGICNIKSKIVNKIYYLFFLPVVLFFSACEKDNIVRPQDSEKSIGEFIDDWTFKVYPHPGSNFDIAEFKLWVPDTVSKLKAIIVLANHYNSNGLNLANSEEWQEFAVNEKIGLLAIHIESISSEYYAYAALGSGNALIKALDTLAYKNNIQAVGSLPFLMRGYSAGGAFCYYFSEFKPERVIGFVNIRGGGIDETKSVNNHIPGLFLIGELETSGINRIKNIIFDKRNQNALWSYAVEPNQDHFGNIMNSDILARHFFSTLLKKRVNDFSNTLINLNEVDGWLGNNDNKQIFSYAAYPNIKSEASWLINEDFAEKWKDFQLSE